MAVAVFKFGGTCLSTFEGRNAAVRHCLDRLSAGDSLVVVVSAMGRTGDPYATDTLASLAPGAPPGERDSLLCCGEIISSVVLAQALRDAGAPARALTGWEAGIVTDGVCGDSDIESVDAGRILECLAGGVVPVVAGFQGVSTGGSVTILGRGGSDTTALAVAAAVEASEAVLFKSVDSIYSADPALVPGAFRIDRIGAEDLRQMSWQGARVVHPRAAEIAGSAGIPVEIRNQDTGEVVTRIEPFTIRSGRYITGVAAGPEVMQMIVEGGDPASPGGFYSQVFGLVAAALVSMDMFSVLDGTAVFTVPLDDSERVEQILSRAGISCVTRGPCSKVSIVGAGMHGMRGVMARFSGALARKGIEMLQTVDSHATISALVMLCDRDEALRTLHGEFMEG